MKFLLAFLLLTGTLLSSCHKHKENSASVVDLDIEEYWKCHNSLPNDSAAIARKLQSNSWMWIQRSCYWTGENVAADKKALINFSNTGTFVITENNIAQKGKWKLRPAGSDDLWELETDIPVPYLDGYVLICNDNIMFYGSYKDGCDHLFTKIEQL